MRPDNQRHEIVSIDDNCKMLQDCMEEIFGIMDIESYTYDVATNTFYDEGGYQLVSVFNIITPNQLFLFKHSRKDMIFRGVDGQLVEFIWEEEVY